MNSRRRSLLKATRRYNRSKRESQGVYGWPGELDPRAMGPGDQSHKLMILWSSINSCKFPYIPTASVRKVHLEDVH